MSITQELLIPNKRKIKKNAKTCKVQLSDSITCTVRSSVCFERKWSLI